MNPKDVNDVMEAFPSRVVGEYLPEWKDIPKEFQGRSTKWNTLGARWFFEGLPEGTEFVPKEGIVVEKALRHLKVCLGSFEPGHEHKDAGVAYLMSLWFEDVIVPEK